MLAVPEGKDEKTELEVYNFTGEGGVALAMYNTDEVWFANPFVFPLKESLDICESLCLFLLLFVFLRHAVHPCFCRGFHDHCL